jgi:two-component system, OmpR family, catabolic regulation response regulator CreB
MSRTTATARQKILVIEDEPSIADNIVYALEKEGFEAQHEKTFEAGLRGALSGRYALVVLDVGLPDGSGFALCQRLRTESQVPILFLSARTEEVDKLVGFEMGADDYLAKPFSPRELVLRIRAILKRSERNQEPGPPSDTPFRIDATRYRITYFEEALELSRYEFRLLELFVKRPGFVFTREKLMEMIWDDPDMSLERTVDTHVKSIRSKLREIRPEIQAIQTHRGLGYSLREEWNDT